MEPIQNKFAVFVENIGGDVRRVPVMELFRVHHRAHAAGHACFRLFKPNGLAQGKAAAGMGGAMDLVTGSRVTIVMSTHTDKAGNPKLVQCTEYPLTGYKCVDYFVSELALVHFTEEGPVLEEISRNTTVEEVVAKTGAKLIIPEKVGILEEC